MIPLRRNHVRCPHCREQFRKGYTFMRHVHWCNERIVVPPSDGATNKRDDGATNEEGATEELPTCVHHDGSEDDSATNEELPHLAELDAYLSAVLGEGGSCLNYANWGNCTVTTQEAETFRFLKVIDAGDGMSRRAAKGVLDYTRGLGGKGLLLPKSMQACWQVLDRVRSTPFHYTIYCKACVKCASWMHHVM